MIKQLQKLMKKNHIDYYIVPTSDEHQSEIIGDFYQFRRYLTGFTGSNGTLLVSRKNAYLWTDGRYFLQASKQLGEDVTLMRMSMPGVPTLIEFLAEHMKEDDVLGFDGTTMSPATILQLVDSLDFDLQYEEIDLSIMWVDRPERSHEPVYLYDNIYHGRDVADKLEELRDFMTVNHCDHHLISTLDDIAWLFNLRGNDIPDSPTALAFAIISQDQASLYLQEGTYSHYIENHYQEVNVTIKDYDDVYEDTALLEGVLLVDTKAINMALYDAINCDIIDEANPTQYFKCIKNDVEIKNTKNAHLKDGIAMTKFMYYLKNNDLKGEDEITIANKLLSYRQQQPLFVEPSFSTICAYGSNAAIIHYEATPDNFSPVDNSHMLMIDSGGQYLDGTTDITRTFVLGDITEEEKHGFTLVLKGFLRLQNAIFNDATYSDALDFIAREPLAKEHLDYRHSTGHGVGHFLNVHENPVSITMRHPFAIRFEPGMITSDEPGLYVDGEYGIRHENELLCVEAKTNEYGRFLTFEPLTLCPIDLEGVDVTMLTDKEKQWLNDYHQLIYTSLKDHLTDEERVWLKFATRSI